MGLSFLPSCDRRSWLCAGDRLHDAAGPSVSDTPGAKALQPSLMPSPAPLRQPLPPGVSSQAPRVMTAGRSGSIAPPAGWAAGGSNPGGLWRDKRTSDADAVLTGNYRATRNTGAVLERGLRLLLFPGLGCGAF